jgi:hypothetical protein
MERDRVPEAVEITGPAASFLSPLTKHMNDAFFSQDREVVPGISRCHVESAADLDS